MNDPARPKHFHIWIPNIFGFKGGIQTYSAFFLQALQTLYPDSQHDVFLMHDIEASSDHLRLPNTTFHFTGSWEPKVRPFAFAAQVLSQSLQKRPDLVITTHINFTVIAQWLKYLNRTPYLTVAHGIEAWNIQKPMLRPALSAADRILCVSHYTRDRLLHEQRLDSSKMGILANTFDTDRFHIAPKPQRLLKRYGLSNEQPVILTVARLDVGEVYKGYDKILWALPKIRHHFPGVRYILVGKGSDTARIQKIIEQQGLEECVTLTGFVPDEELGDYYNLCDVFAMPSRKEGFGIVFLEALASGKPVLAGNCDGSVDALCGGKLGALINPDSIDEIATVLTQILQGTYSHPLIYQPEILRQKVTEVFGFEHFKSTLSEYMDKLLIS